MNWKPEDVTELVGKRDYDTALAALQYLIDEGVGIDEIRDTRYTGHPPIWVRMLSDGRDDAAKLAILAGADVNARSTSGTPALAIAAEKGFDEIVALLVGRGADVNPTCEFDSPLSAAAQGGHSTIVDALLAAGANVNSVNKYEHTPIMGAAISGDVAIIQRLVAHGANANAKDKMGHGAMYYAVANQKTAVIDYLTSIEAGSARPEKVQAIVSFSCRSMSEWDTDELHRQIKIEQNEMGCMTDTAVFKAENVVAGDSIGDPAYMYAYLRETLIDLGGHELISRCYVHDFVASNGNSGSYVVVLDRSIDPGLVREEQRSSSGAVPLNKLVSP